MRIEGLTICRGYADFLAQTLPHNLAHFDDFLVVTSYDDSATQALCRRLSVECRPTDLFDKDAPGKGFAKGRAIDWGLGYLLKSDWIVHLDADIYLPPMTRHWIEASEPDQSCIYGCDRVNCIGWDAWQRFLSAGQAELYQHRHHCLTTAPVGMELGSRLCLRQHGGYLPIGFFQMWWGPTGRRYPLRQTSAEHTDVLHAMQWPRDKRRLMEEVIAVHLESEPARMGANWAGRTTAPFGPAGKSETDTCGYRNGGGYV